MVIFPGGSTALLQPVDNGVGKAFHDEMTKYASGCTTRAQVMRILNDAIKVATTSTIVSRAWDVTGHEPFKPDRILTHLLYPHPDSDKIPKKKRRTRRIPIEGCLFTGESMVRQLRESTKRKRQRRKKV